MSGPRRLGADASPARARGRVPFPLTEEQRAQWRPFKRRGWKNNSLVQLTLVRLREFIRGPEGGLWTFMFPFLLSAGLGISLRQRCPCRVRRGIISRAPGSGAVIASV